MVRAVGIEFLNLPTRPRLIGVRDRKPNRHRKDRCSREAGIPHLARWSSMKTVPLNFLDFLPEESEVLEWKVGQRIPRWRTHSPVGKTQYRKISTVLMRLQQIANSSQAEHVRSQRTKTKQHISLPNKSARKFNISQLVLVDLE